MVSNIDENNDSLHHVMESYYKHIGQCHVENIVWEADKLESEMDFIKIPESLDQWFESYSEDIKAQEERFMRKRNRKRILSKAAIFIVVLFMSFSILTFNVDAFRVKVLNLIVDIKDLYSGVRVEEGIGKDNTEKSQNEYYLKYIPEGYVLEGTNKIGDTITMEYNKDGSETIVFEQSPMNSEFHFDTEASQLKEVQINGTDGILVERSHENILFWNNQEYCFYIISKLEPTILMQMANSLEKK